MAKSQPFIRGISRRPVLLILPALLLLTCVVPPPAPGGGSVWLEPEQRDPVDLSGVLKTFEGQDVLLKDLEHKALFVNFWATWCAPCREEMPSMAALYNQFSDQGLEMVAISAEEVQVVQNFLQDTPYPFRTWLDPQDTLSQRFEVYAIPTTLIVDHQGRLVFRQLGALDWDSPEMVARFRQLLNEAES